MYKILDLDFALYFSSQVSIPSISGGLVEVLGGWVKLRQSDGDLVFILHAEAQSTVFQSSGVSHGRKHLNCLSLFWAMGALFLVIICDCLMGHCLKNNAVDE